jgi:hypothetical protein
VHVRRGSGPDFREPVEGINTRLHESKLAIEEYGPLPANEGRSFQGPIPAGSFYLGPGEARAILDRVDANYEEVVRPYLIGDDITEEPMGILTSSTHGAWAHSEKSTLEDRPRYTPTSCFETFPWPQPDAAIRGEIGEIAKDLIDRRQAICVENEIGLTDLYNRVDEGAWSEIAEFHRRLDEAVADAFGWERAVAHDPLEPKARLAALHASIVGGAPYAPFG